MAKEALLIHGWDPKLYNSKLERNIDSGIAWKHRPELINLLSEKYKIDYFNLPGFCGVAEPNQTFFDVKDFTDYLANWIKQNNKNPDFIIGYSFGGVIALDYKARYNNSIPTILISPAIRRFESLWSKFAHTIKDNSPNQLSIVSKKYYQYLLSRYYREGTPFLRESYDLIVRKDSTSLLDKVEPDSLLLIYGNNDSATPWPMVEKKVIESEIQHYLIMNGEHNIGQTHPQEIFHAIDDFLEK